MCGIAGIWRCETQDKADPVRLVRMLDTLTHRGPDDHAYLFLDSATGRYDLTQAEATSLNANVLLAHRRLSIIDTSPHGQQPMHNETGDVFLVFNGEIYNYIELRKELEGLGHVFSSHTDSEVIVHAYEEWGVDCCKRFNGMWAYVIWDQRERKLVCSRDRFGIKPFFFAKRDDRFLFGSEIKSILPGLDEEARPNYPVIAKYLTSMWRPRDDQVFFQDIEDLAPAHNMIVTAKGVQKQRYWDYSDQSESYDYSDPEDTFRTLFADSIRLRLRSDVPVSILLSGGLDSTAVAAFASKSDLGYPMKSFTAIFPNRKFDEHEYAKQVASLHNLPFHTVEYNPDNLLEDLSAVVRSQDAPTSSAQVLPRWRLLSLVAEHSKVVLEGQGADEMLAGYVRSYFVPYMRDELSHINLLNMRSTGKRLSEAWDTTLGNLDDTRSITRAWSMFRMIRSARRQSQGVLSGDLRASLRQFGDSPDGSSPFPDHLTRALHRDHARNILPSMLRFGDSISMAHSVESRLPFMDYRLVEFCFGLPYQWKFSGRWSKNMMRRAFHNELPDEIRMRTDKVGFTSPVMAWLRQHMKDSIIPILCSKQAKSRGLFDDGLLRQKLELCQNGDWRFARFVFRCLAMELWFQQYMDE